MSQISMPVRIVLVGAVVFLAAWFTVLRPKTATVEPATTTTPASTPVTGPGKAVAAARKAAGATATATPAAAATSQTKSAPAAEAATPASAIPAGALAKLPKGVAHALRANDILVLGVIADGQTRWRPLADDDRYVRNALRHVNRYDGEVFVKTVPLAKLATYAPVVGNLQVNQTPTVVIVDRKLKGRVLTGYVDRLSLNQAIADARGPVELKSPFLRKANALCGQYEIRTSRWSQPTVDGVKAEHAALNRLVAVVKDYRAGIARIPAGAKWRGLKDQWLGVMAMRQGTLERAVSAYKRQDAAGLYAAIAGFDSKSVRRLDHRFDAADLTSCSILRRS